MIDEIHIHILWHLFTLSSPHPIGTKEAQINKTVSFIELIIRKLKKIRTETKKYNISATQSWHELFLNLGIVSTMYIKDSSGKVCVLGMCSDRNVVLDIWCSKLKTKEKKKWKIEKLANVVAYSVKNPSEDSSPLSLQNVIDHLKAKIQISSRSVRIIEIRKIIEDLSILYFES